MFPIEICLDLKFLFKIYVSILYFYVFMLLLALYYSFASFSL